jgi:O-antigen/teichoic acid export membrane protein
MGGTFVGAIVPVVTSPIMSRIFSPTDYGVIGIYMSLCGLIGVLAFSHYQHAVILTKSEKESKQSVWFSLCVCCTVSLIVGLVIALLHILYPEGTFSLGRWAFWIPLSIIANGVSSTLFLWANRNQCYRQMASNRLVQALITVFFQIVFGITMKNESGLMVGLLAGQIGGSLLLFRHFIFNRTYGIGAPEFGAFKGLAYKYQSLVLLNTPSEFINNLIAQLPVFLLQKYVGLSVVGSYNFTQRILGLPQIFFSSAVVDIFKQKASSAYNSEGNCRAIFTKTAIFLAAFAIIPFAFLALFAPYIFLYVFGSQWTEAGIFAQYLSLLFFFRFIVSPLSYMYIIAGRLKEDLVLHVFFLFLTVGSFYFGNFLFEQKKYILLLYSILYSCVYLVYFIRSYHFSKGNLQ